MKVIGIIAEYNPFHNGHLYQINKIKNLYPDSIIITVISSSFSQRGEPIILDKWERTQILLDNNVDLIVELPYSFSTQSADIFAKGGIQILNALKIDILAFGVETDDVSNLEKAAKIQIKNKKFDMKVKEYLNKKYNYRSSISKSIFDLTKINIDSPNDILAVTYIKEIINQNKNIEILPIKRTNDYLDLISNENIISASNIRNKIKNNFDIKKYVPKECYNFMKHKKYNDNEILFNLLKFKILSDNNLDNYCMMDEGIENRIKSNIFKCKTMEELIEKVKTKRYTSNKIKRTFLHLITSFKKEDSAKYSNISYIRMLGFNEKGKNYINKIKKEIKKPILTNYKKGFEMLEVEIKITAIYDIVMDTNLLLKEYSNKPIIK